MRLTQDVLALTQQSVLCWLATSSAEGQPSVSPKEVFAPLGTEAIIIANIASPGSARNIRENPRACVAFINIFTQKGYQIAGPAALLKPTDPRYAEPEAILLEITKGHYPFSSIFRVTPEQVRPIIAPRYSLFPDTTEEQQINSAMRTYGVRPAQPDPTS